MDSFYSGYHLLVFHQWRGFVSDIYPYHVLIGKFSAFKRLNGFDGPAARSAPGIPEIHQNDFSLVRGNDGIEKLGIFHVRRFRHLRETGVTATGGGERWTRARHETFSAAYARTFPHAEGGVALTYEPFWYVGVRR